MKQYDVIVVGGGVSGAVAGIASARAGARTLIAEKMGFLGGMLTAGGVGPMMTFLAGDTQVVQGIAEEIVQRLIKCGGSTGHIVDTTGYTYTVTPFDAELLKNVLENMVLEAGGELLYHSMLDGVKTENGRITSVEFATKSGKMELAAKVYIDATGDGDLAAWSGVDFLLGRDKDHYCQPVTMNFKVSNVDIDSIRDYIKKNPSEFNEADPKLLDLAPRLSLGGFTKTFAKGRETGEISFSRECLQFFETNNKNEVIFNTTRMQKVKPTDAWELSKAEIEGRRQSLELFEFVKKHVVGFENAVLLYTGPNLGIRESRKIRGKYVLTAEDLLDTVPFEDEIACGGYPIDIHSPDGEGTKSRHLSWGAIYGIPYRSLINDRIGNLINVGRCISCTHEACAAIRLSPIAMAIGQAGGTAAGLCIKDGCGVGELKYPELREELLKNGAYLRKQ